MSEIDSRFVKLGLWTNLEQGEIMRKTITTDIRTGVIIIALLAVMSNFGKFQDKQAKLSLTCSLCPGTSHLWNLIVFALHQARASGHPTDGLFRQQQAA
jgi:hypothetical protein